MLLHALGCTGLLTWFPAIAALARRYRVVTLDQRWHGQGIRSDEFSLDDCADDVAALLDVLGHRRGDRRRLLDGRRSSPSGCGASTATGRAAWCSAPPPTGSRTPRRAGVLHRHGREMLGARAASPARAPRRGPPGVAAGALDLDAHATSSEWAMREFRSTSPWAVGQALAALGRHHSRPWLGRIDVPTAVVVTTRDRVIPPARQDRLARRIPGATIHEVDGGHAACVLEAEKFVPALLEAVGTVNARRRDFTAALITSCASAPR